MTNFWKLQKWKYRYEGKLYYLINLLIILMAIYLASNRISHGSVLIRTGAKLRCAPFFAGLQTGFFITLRSRRSCVDQEVSTLSETRCGFVWKQGTPTVIYHHVPYHSGQKSEGVWCSYTVYIYIYIHWYIPLISLDTPTQKKGKHVEKNHRKMEVFTQNGVRISHEKSTTSPGKPTDRNLDGEIPTTPRCHR